MRKLILLTFIFFGNYSAYAIQGVVEEKTLFCLMTKECTTDEKDCKQPESCCSITYKDCCFIKKDQSCKGSEKCCSQLREQIQTEQETK